MKKPKLVAFMAFVLALLLFNELFSQEYVTFNKVKSTTSINNNQLNNLTTVSGSGFTFNAQNSTFALSKTGNTINGTLSFANANGSSLSYVGKIEGKFTASSNTIGLYFTSGTTYFVLIIPGFETHVDFDDNDNPNFNSSSTDAEVESLKQIKLADNNTLSNQSNKLSIYLNPATEEISFSIPKDEKANSISIIDANGTKMLIKSKSSSKQMVSISDLKKGNYLLEVKTQMTTRTANFLKN